MSLNNKTIELQFTEKTTTISDITIFYPVVGRDMFNLFAGTRLVRLHPGYCRIISTCLLLHIQVLCVHDFAHGVFVSVSVQAHVHLHVSVHVHVFCSVHVCVHEYMCTSLCICVHLYSHVHMYMCI